MVYCGKPSKACEPCREKRLRCNLQRPACSQCINGGKSCPGYRDQLDLCFRDESAAVIRKARKKWTACPSTISAPGRNLGKTRSRCRMSSLESSSEPEDIQTILNKTSDVMLCSIPKMSIEQTAMAHFMNTYISGSHFDYIPQVYAASPSDTPLSAALIANACANLFRETRDPFLLAKGQRYYLEALAQTNTAIYSPENAILDSTIASVLLLGLYETLTQGYRRCPESFIVHNNGASALLKLRGEEQFSTVIGKGIYRQVSLNMRVTCTDRNVDLPADFLAIDEIARAHFGEDDFLTRFLRILDGFNRLRIDAAAEVLSGQITNATVETAVKLDQFLAGAMAKFSISLEYKKVTTSHQTPGVLGRAYHTYADHRATQRWNAMRMIRLILNEHVHEHMSHMVTSSGQCSTTTFLLQQLASRNVEDMARQICASVPQFTKPGSNGLLAVTPTLFLLWPLSIAGNSRLSPPDVRAYVIDRLRFLGKEARLPQSTWAADMIQERKPMEDWLHLSHLA